MVRGMTLLMVLGLGLVVCTATPSADQAAGSHQETPTAPQHEGGSEPTIALQPARYLETLRKELPGLPEPRLVSTPDAELVWSVYSQVPDAMEKRTVAAPGTAFERAVRVEIKRPLQYPGTAGCSCFSAQPVRKGDVLLGILWVRAVKPNRDGTMPMLRAGWQENGGYWRIFTGCYRPLTTEWERIEIPFKADRDYASKGIGIVVMLGSEAQEIELGGLAMLDFGKEADVAALPASQTSAGSSRTRS